MSPNDSFRMEKLKENLLGVTTSVVAPISGEETPQIPQGVTPLIEPALGEASLLAVRAAEPISEVGSPLEALAAGSAGEGLVPQSGLTGEHSLGEHRQEAIPSTSGEGAPQSTLLSPKPASERRTAAERKKIRKMIRKGHSYEVAKSMITTSQKRARSDGSTPEGAISKRPRELGEKEGDSHSYSQVVSGVRIGITPENFPESLLTETQVGLLKGAILRGMKDLKGEGLLPQFSGAIDNPGWVVFHCDNRATADWLKTITTTIVPWEGARLRAVEGEEIPHRSVVVGYFPGGAGVSNKEILGYLRLQNGGSFWNQWKLLRREVHGKDVRLVYSVDPFSVSELRKNKFLLSYMFDKVKLVLREKGKVVNESEEGKNARRETEASGIVPGAKGRGGGPSAVGAAQAAKTGGVGPSSGVKGTPRVWNKSKDGKGVKGKRMQMTGGVKGKEREDENGKEKERMIEREKERKKERERERENIRGFSKEKVKGNEKECGVCSSKGMAGALGAIAVSKRGGELVESLGKGENKGQAPKNQRSGKPKKGRGKQENASSSSQ